MTVAKYQHILGMAEARKLNNTAMYSLSGQSQQEESFDSETEEIAAKRPFRKRPQFVIVCVFLMVLSAFATGVVIGFFIKAGLNNETNGSQRDIKKDSSEALQTLLNILSKERLQENVRHFSERARLAGSQFSKDLADEIGSKWKSYGFHVDKLEYDVLLPRAKDGSPDYFEIRTNEGNVTMRHTFAAVGKSDPSSNKTWSIPRYFFYSPSGSSHGGLLYVNEGRKKDFDYLKKINITSCNGSVLLMKCSYQRILDQLKYADECGANGLLLFCEDFVKTQTSGSGEVYPNGTLLSEEQPLAFSLRQDLAFGDPLTPDLPASDGIYRLDETGEHLPAKLPVQIVEFEIAKTLLEHLQGSPLPKEWKLNSTNSTEYKIGPHLKDNLTLHLIVNSKSERTTIYDVIGTIYGLEEPDDWVLIGNHRDSIAFGAVDAGSGNAGMMELSRGIGELLKKGWQPRRTIKFCSWAAEETGLIGSTEYVDDNKKLLQQRAVAYINIDMLVHGNDSLKAAGNPLMADLVYSETSLVKDPNGTDGTIYSVWKKKRPDGQDRPQFNTIGRASDYVAFYEMAGVPSLDLQYAKVPFRPPTSYHTVYDTYHFISMFDPHFHFHLAQTKLTARLTYKLVNSELIPFNLNSFTAKLREISNRTRFVYERQLNEHGITLKTLMREISALEKAGRQFEIIKNESNIKPEKVKRLNRRMIAFNKIFISPESIPERLNLKHLVLGISQNNCYPNITLAGISDSVIVARASGRWDLVKRQVSLTQHAITQARRSLEMP